MPYTSDQIFSSANIPIIEIDADLKIRRVGKAFTLRMTEVVEGGDFRSLFPTIDIDMLLKDPTTRSRINLYKTHTSPVSHEVSAVRYQGSVFLIFEPVIEDIQRMQNEIIRMNNDLTNAMREIQKKNAELAQLNALKNEFLGIAAHDLRTPIANIYSFSDLALLDSDRLDTELLQYLTEIKALAEFMMDLLNDLLDLSVIESGNLNLKREQVSLAEIISRSVKLHLPMAVKRKVRINSQLESGQSSVNVDSLKVGQVCNNLINNAIKFSPEDSEITIRSGKSAGECWFEVCDRGPGIESSQITQIFEPFRKGSLQVPGSKGHGLGLAISKKIVDAHGGRMLVDSKPGEGTTFRVSFPENSASA